MLAVGFLLGALALYSSPGELAAPPFATISLTSTFSIAEILYTVTPVSSTIADITIAVNLPHNVSSVPARAPAAKLYLEIPSGATFQTCPPPSCGFVRGDDEYSWFQPLNFDGQDQGSGDTDATATFTVKARNFGYVLNDTNASAAIPRVVFLGPGSLAPILYTKYIVTSADNYNWSSFQPQLTSTREIAWDEPVAGGDTQGLAASGVNYANEAKDSDDTFLAGAFVGLAGGALLAALQEFLHRGDDEATAKAVIGALRSASATGEDKAAD